MTDIAIDRAKEHWRHIKDGFQEVKPTRTVLSGDGRGNAASNLYSAANSRYVYAREYGSDKFFTVRNPNGVGSVYVNMPLILGYDERLTHEEIVLGIDYDALPSNWAGSAIYGMGPHAFSHAFRGGDDVFLDSRQYLPGLVHPQKPVSAYVDIEPVIYQYGGVWSRSLSQTSADITSFKPSSNGRSRYVTLALDPLSGSVVYRLGPEQIGGTLLEILENPQFEDYVPAPGGDEIPLGTIFVSASTTQIDWISSAKNVYDGRFHAPASLRKILERLDQLEGHSGNNPDMMTIGVAGSRTDNAGWLRKFDDDRFRLGGFEVLSSGNFAFHNVTPASQSPAYSITNDTNDRAFDANSTSIDEVADVLATVIRDLELKGILG